MKCNVCFDYCHHQLVTWARVREMKSSGCKQTRHILTHRQLVARAMWMERENAIVTKLYLLPIWNTHNSLSLPKLPDYFIALFSLWLTFYYWLMRALNKKVIIVVFWSPWKYLMMLCNAKGILIANKGDREMMATKMCRTIMVTLMATNWVPKVSMKR